MGVPEASRRFDWCESDMPFLSTRKRGCALARSVTVKLRDITSPRKVRVVGCWAQRVGKIPRGGGW